MPDMRTAFSNAFNRVPDIQKAIAEWEDTEAQPIKTQEKQMPYVPQATPDITLAEATYNYIKANPSTSRQDILKGMEAKGFNVASITTMLSQGLMCGLLRKDVNSRYLVVYDNFIPTTVKMLRKARVAKQKARREVKLGIAALKPQAKVEKEPKYETVAIVSSNTSVTAPKEVPPTDIDALLNSLTFNQAIGLYKKLKTMLGEV